MKKYLLSILPFLAFTIFSNAQELVTDGNMENDASWTALWRSDAPNEGEDFQAGQGDYIYAMNVWMTAPYDAFKVVGFDGTFEEDFQFKWIGGGASGDSVFTEVTTFPVPDTTSVTTWYVVIKAGCWGDAGDLNNSFNLLFDEISLVDEGEAPSALRESNANNNQLFDISPNPSDGEVHVNLIQNGIVTYKIFNNLGMIIDTGTLSVSTPLDLTNCSSGTYYISVTKGSRTETQRLIVK